MTRVLVAICCVLSGFGVLGVTSHGTALAAGGNADATHACMLGGYANLMGIDGTTFKNAGQCVSYAAQGGFIPGVTACNVTATTGCLTFDNVVLQWTHAGTLTLTGSISFVKACATGSCGFGGYNNLATGGGTYVATSGLAGGTFRVAATPGTWEGLYFLTYSDSSGAPATSCAAANGQRQVVLGVTLLDGPTQNPTGYILTASTGASPGSGYLQLSGSLDEYFGNSPGISITC